MTPAALRSLINHPIIIFIIIIIITKSSTLILKHSSVRMVVLTLCSRHVCYSLLYQYARLASLHAHYTAAEHTSNMMVIQSLSPNV